MPKHNDVYTDDLADNLAWLVMGALCGALILLALLISI